MFLEIVIAILLLAGLGAVLFTLGGKSSKVGTLSREQKAVIRSHAAWSPPMAPQKRRAVLPWPRMPPQWRTLQLTKRPSESIGGSS